MRSRLAFGEWVLAAAFAGIGAFWMVTAASMPLWEGFAPGSGFLPLVYGALLAVLAAAAAAASLLASKPDAGSERESVRKPMVVVGVLVLGVAAVEPLGFIAAIFAMLFFLYAVVERRPIPLALAVAGATAAALAVVFRTWLGVPLPVGPWGF